MDTPRFVRTPSRAVQLLSRLIATGWFDRDAIAQELVVPAAVLERYLDGSQPIPLDRQLCLALFVIEKVPPLAREGRRLRGQVNAAIVFRARETETHITAPPRPWFP